MKNEHISSTRTRRTRCELSVFIESKTSSRLERGRHITSYKQGAREDTHCVAASVFPNINAQSEMPNQLITENQ